MHLYFLEGVHNGIWFKYLLVLRNTPCVFLKLALSSSVGAVKLVCSSNYSVQACTIRKRKKEAVNQQCVILEAHLLCLKYDFTTIEGNTHLQGTLNCVKIWVAKVLLAFFFFFKSGEVLHYKVFATEILEGHGLGKFQNPGSKSENVGL